MYVNQQDERDEHRKNEERRLAFLNEASSLPSLQLSDETMVWFELLASGALAPLDRFMSSADVASVQQTMHLTDGAFFPVPVVLPLIDASLCAPGQRLALRSRQNHLLALLTVNEIFEYETPERSGWALSGPMDVLRTPPALLFPHLRETPAKLRSRLAARGGGLVLAADGWNPLDEAQTSWLRQRAAENGELLLVNLMTTHERLDDFELFQWLRLCETHCEETLGPRALLNVTGMPKLASGARCLLLRALIHRNYGAESYLLAADAMTEFTREDFSAWETGIAALGIEAVSPMVPRSSSASRQRLLAALHPHEQEAGFCLWFTGLPGAGKSTIAEQVVVRLMENNRRVTLLDGDVVRTHLSKGLGFSREDRDTNVQRIGFVASEIVRHRGVAVCAAVSPYRESRDRVREMMKPSAFVEVFVNTPVSVCEQRDVKGFYTKARKGAMHSFTGVDDPYEAPERAEIVLETKNATPAEEAERVMQYLISHGLLDMAEIEEDEDTAARHARLASQPS
ncbi:adenylyl-sulfate kinase [Silvibacterium sp.]|uniref:adenylyl-sulfate kinase n=1 Tax=Silvibacterium sp. TaxID=1964179 RepID=UPI0039E30498